MKKQALWTILDILNRIIRYLEILYMEELSDSDFPEIEDSLESMVDSIDSILWSLNDDK